MAKTLDEFGRRMQEIGKNIEKNTTKKVRLAALAIHQTLVLATPVDTGRARSNWQVRTGTGAREEIEAYAPGRNLGKGEGNNAQATLNQGRGAIASHIRGQDIFITNNLPYIQRLNEGSSSQAPAGFVESAIKAGARASRKQKVVE